MIYDNIAISEQSKITNLTVATGNVWPSSPNQGELFYYNGANPGLYIHNGGSWNLITISSQVASSTAQYLVKTADVSVPGAIAIDQLSTGILHHTGSGDLSAGSIPLSDPLLTGILPTSKLPGLTGDVSSLDGSNVLTLADVVGPGTYKSVTVDAKGRVTSGTNPSTLEGYGITNAVKKDSSGTPQQVDGPLTVNYPGMLSPAQNELVTKQYVDGLVAGLDFKESVRVATTSDLVTVSGLLIVDGVQLVEGDRVLVKNQSDASQNGIYIVGSGFWTRSEDTQNVSTGALTYVEAGTQAGKSWVLSTTGEITNDVTPQNWVIFSSGIDLSAGTGVIFNPSTGVISIGQPVSTTSNVTFNQITGTSQVSTPSVILTSASPKVTFSNGSSVIELVSNPASSSTQTITLPQSSGTLLTDNSISSVTNKTFDVTNSFNLLATNTILYGSVSQTKGLKFDVETISSNGIKTLGLPSTLVDGDKLLAAESSQTVKNKTFDSTNTWNGGVIDVEYGGTGIDTYVPGDILYASGTSTLTSLPAASTGNVLLSGTTPTWGKVDLSAHISGVLSMSNGGTGTSSVTTGIVYSDGTSLVSASGTQITAAIGTEYVTNATNATNSINATNAAIATTISTTLSTSLGGTGLTSYAIGDLLYANGTASLTSLAAASTGNVLLSGTTPSWGKVNLTTHVSGVLPMANGGTGTSSVTGVVYSNGITMSAATGAQLVSAIGANAVTNATSATNATYASYSNEANAAWQSAALNSSVANNDTTYSAVIRNVTGTSDTTVAALGFLCQGSYGIKLHLRGDGYFGIGGWSRAAWSWYTDPSGNTVAAGNVSAYSDPRLKENFKRIEKPLELISKLDGGTFNWKSGIEHIAIKAGKKDYGILADQVEAIMPEIVTESIELEGESYKTVCYEKLVPVLIEAIKELTAKVEKLENSDK